MLLHNFIKLYFLFLLCCDRLSVYLGTRVIFLKYSLDVYSLTTYDVPGTEVLVRETANTGEKKSLWPYESYSLVRKSDRTPPEERPHMLMHAKLLPSCPTLFDPVGWAPLSMGFSRQEYWSGLPFSSPGDLPDPGMETVSLTSSSLAG